MNVSRETSERLERYAELIRQWNPRINLVAPGSVEHLKTRHIDDCLQVAKLTPEVVGTWADLGSGGGLPGLVIAIAFSEQPATFTLVESDQRKCAFLRTVVRELNLPNTTIKTARIESLDPLNADQISARALAPLPRLMPYLDRHLARDGCAWLMKGQRWQAEVTEAREEWQFDCTAYPSRSQDGAAILKISGVGHVPA